MTTKREDVLAALYALIGTLSGPTVARNIALPPRIPAAGLVICRDGNPGDPETTLSPLTYHFEHQAEIEVLLQGAGRDGDFDDVLRDIGTLLTANRDLGGRVDWLETAGIEPVDMYVEGADPIKAGVVTVLLHYASADPLT